MNDSTPARPNEGRGTLRIVTAGHAEVASSRLRVYALLAKLDSHPRTRSAWVLPDSLVRVAAQLATRPILGLKGKVLRRLITSTLQAFTAVGVAYVSVWLAVTTKPDDVVLIQKVLLPRNVVSHVRRRCRRLVFDFDDAVYELSPASRDRTRTTISLSDATITSVEHNAAFARDAGGNVTVLVTPVDVARFMPTGPWQASKRFTIGWIGSPSTTRYLIDIAQELREVASARPVRFVFIGAAYFPAAPPETEFVPWSIANEERILPTLDVGLMPLRAGPWEDGKGGYKALQYMASGVPTVASDVPAGRPYVSHGVTGLLVPDAGSWGEALCYLLDHPHEREHMRLEARRMAVARYSLEQALRPWQHAVFGDGPAFGQRRQ